MVNSQAILRAEGYCLSQKDALSKIDVGAKLIEVKRVVASQVHRGGLEKSLVHNCCSEGTGKMEVIAEVDMGD